MRGDEMRWTETRGRDEKRWNETWGDETRGEEQDEMKLKSQEKKFSWDKIWHEMKRRGGEDVRRGNETIKDLTRWDGMIWNIRGDEMKQDKKGGDEDETKWEMRRDKKSGEDKRWRKLNIR